MTQSQHKRTAVVSMVQNSIFQNTKCAIRDGFKFCRDSHIYVFANMLITLPKYFYWLQIGHLKPIWDASAACNGFPLKSSMSHYDIINHLTVYTSIISSNGQLIGLTKMFHIP